MSSSLFTELGVQGIDHVAVTTANLEVTMNDFLGLHGARLIRGPGENAVQRVRYAFVLTQEGTTIEVLAPFSDSPILKHVERGGGAYHFCYTVADIDSATALAPTLGARLVVEAARDPAFDGRRVAFFFHPYHGIFELVESSAPSARSESAPTCIQHARKEARVGRLSEDQVHFRMQEVFRSVFRNLADGEIVTATFGQTQEWDSLTHLQLVYQMETEFGLSIPAEKFSELTSFEEFIRFVLRSTEA